jgi:hypothetical protein
MDELRRQTLLDDCDVPLALVCWTQTGVKWVDMWAVRRRSVRPAVGDPWSLLVDDRRLAESEAMLLQFQRQLEEMLPEPGLKSMTAKSRLQYLPPAGYLPVDTAEFDREKFFQSLTVTTEEVDLAFVRQLIRKSLDLDPIDLAAPPPLRVFFHEEAPGYVLFARDEHQPTSPPEPPDQDAEPPPDAGPKTGRMVIDVGIEPDEQALATPFLRKKERRDKARQILFDGHSQDAIKDAALHDAVADSSAVEVYAVDQRGHTYPAAYVARYGLSQDVERDAIAFRQGFARFSIKALPPGSYTVYVKASGYKTASKHASVTAGGRSTVAIMLVPEDVKDGGKPSKQPEGGADAEWILPKWYGKLYAFEKYAKWPWPPDPEILWGYDPVVDPPPYEVDAWIEEWVDYLQTRYPEAPIDPGDVQIYIDKSYTPDAVFEQPYAYLTFGKSGLYMPAVLTGKDTVLDRSVSIGKAGLPGVDSDVATQFGNAGATSVEALTAAWTGLVQDVMGVGASAARGFVETARAKVAALQGGLQLFSGVDAALETALNQKGHVDSPEALANADPQALVTAVGADMLSLGMAQLLVDQARGAVPKSVWSLAESALGLKANEVAELARLGVTTQGEFKARAGAVEGRNQIGAALGIPASQVETIAGGIVIRDASAIKAGLQAAAAVTHLVGIDHTAGLALATMGFNSLGQLALADANALAGAFGGDTVRAAGAVAAARLRLGL